MITMLIFIFFLILKVNLYCSINPLKSIYDFSDQTWNLLDMKYDNFGWTFFKRIHKPPETVNSE